MPRRGDIIRMSVAAILFLVGGYLLRGTGWDYIAAGGAMIAIVIIIHEARRGDRENNGRKS